MSAPNQDGPTPLEITNEGGTFIVRDKQGNPREVFLRLLPVGQYKDYALVLEDEEKAVDLLANTPGLTATLPPDSIGTLMEEGERMNAAFFPWLRRRMRRIERVSGVSLATPPGTNTSPGSVSATA